MQQLCIKLHIVERRVTVYDVLHLLTVKTAAARRVGQEVEPVAGTYKRGHTCHFTEPGSIGAARLHGAKLHQILKFGVVQLVVAVKLVEVDKRKARQRQFKTLVAGQLKLVSVVIAQFGRQQHAAKRTFAHTLLLAHQQRYHGIATGACAARSSLHPTSHHAAQPAPEHHAPQRIGAHPFGQWTHAVGAVSLGQGLQISAEGVILRHVSRLHNAVHIIVPHHAAPFMQVNHHRVAHQFAHGHKPFVSLVAP